MPDSSSQHRPALYRLERTENGYKFTIYSMRGQGTESASGAGQASATSTAAPRRMASRTGQEVVHEKIKRNAGGEYAGKGKEDNSRMAHRTPRGEFREHPAGARQRPATVRVRRRR
ncbi:MAG: hypothetical protein LBV60_01440 [Streptomyces sp.]|jgi:hypothetical protein|nr:hypothetical protein [Streptomyces sp.]